MSTVFLIVWVAFIVLGIVSNIRKSIRKAAAQNRAAAPVKNPVAAQQRAARVPIHTKTIASVQVPQVLAPQPASTTQPVVTATRATQPRAVAAPRVAAAPKTVVPGPAKVGIFANNRSIVQAIIAQQVLGPPLALSEQSIWKQR